jgi:heme/copper-type cytochrome/quinol oxidase subunit 2
MKKVLVILIAVLLCFLILYLMIFYKRRPMTVKEEEVTFDCKCAGTPEFNIVDGGPIYTGLGTRRLCRGILYDCSGKGVLFQSQADISEPKMSFFMYSYYGVLIFAILVVPILIIIFIFFKN